MGLLQRGGELEQQGVVVAETSDQRVLLHLAPRARWQKPASEGTAATVGRDFGFSANGPGSGLGRDVTKKGHVRNYGVTSRAVAAL